MAKSVHSQGARECRCPPPSICPLTLPILPASETNAKASATARFATPLARRADRGASIREPARSRRSSTTWFTPASWACSMPRQKYNGDKQVTFPRLREAPDQGRDSGQPSAIWIGPRAICVNATSSWKRSRANWLRSWNATRPRPRSPKRWVWMSLAGGRSRSKCVWSA